MEDLRTRYLTLSSSKKKFLIIIIVFSYPNTNLFCQSSKSTLSLSIGPSFPLGNYAKTDPANNLSGYSKAGESINISFNYKLNNGVVFEAMLYGERNGLNTKAFANQFSEVGFFTFYGDPRYYSNWTIDKKSWNVESLLLGVTRHWLIGKPNSRISILAKTLVGLANVQSPELNANSKTDTSYVILHQNNSSAIGTSFLLSAGAEYKLSKNLGILFSCEYYGTTQIFFKNLTEIIAATNGGLGVPEIYSLSNSVSTYIAESYADNNKQTISSININLGICFTL